MAHFLHPGRDDIPKPAQPQPPRTRERVLNVRAPRIACACWRLAASESALSSSLSGRRRTRLRSPEHTPNLTWSSSEQRAAGRALSFRQCVRPPSLRVGRVSGGPAVRSRPAGLDQGSDRLSAGSPCNANTPPRWPRRCPSRAGGAPASAPAVRAREPSSDERLNRRRSGCSSRRHDAQAISNASSMAGTGPTTGSGLSARMTRLCQRYRP